MSISQNDFGEDSKFVGSVETGAITLKTAITNTTDEDVPDPTGFEVLNQFVCIRPLGIEKKTKSGLIIPDVAAERTEKQLTFGRVIGIGSEACKRDGVSKVQVGDLVVFPKFGNAEIVIKGVKLVLCYDDILLCKIEKDAIHGDNSKIMYKI